MQERLECAIQIIKEAGNLTLEYFYRTDYIVERKADQSPVTAADRKAELLLRERIAQRFPDDGVFGEEFPAQKGKNDFRWILDPIDGTKSFIHGVPLYSTLIGVEYQGEPLIGVIRVPAIAETVWALKGNGAWHESSRFEKVRPASVSSCTTLSEGLFLVSEVATFEQVQRQKAYSQLQNQCRLARTWGDAYGYFLVATGRAEVMIDPIMSLWDAAPLQTIIEEAGGRFTDWQGKPTIYHEEAVATNGLIHNEVLAVTKQFPKIQNP